MNISYIGHSGFAIECKNDCTLAFDFFKDLAEVMPAILDRSERVYSFVSHSHPDHFNHRIFNWANDYSAQFTHILAHEMKRKLQRSKVTQAPESAIFLHRGDKFSDSSISVQAFGSTDIGVSYLVEIDEIKIFHAGDLNNWHWSEESTPQEIKAAEGNYLAILRDIKVIAPHIDIVMFPVDPRIGGDYPLGARQFLQAIEVEHFIPMHQWGDYERSCNFNLYRAASGEYHCMHDGDTITV